MRKGIYKDEKRGTWFIHVKVQVNDEYKDATIRGYSSKGEANADYDRAIQEWVKKHTKHCKAMFFSDLLNECRLDRSTSIKIQTLRVDDSIYSKYLNPAFGNQLIENVFKKDVISDWYSGFVTDTTITVNRKNKVITRFKDVLAHAYRHLYIDAPTYQICDVMLKHIRENIVQKKEKDVWTREEYEKFIDAIPTDVIWYPFFVLFGELGCRIGEIQGLMWKHFDADKKLIFIRQQVIEGTGEGHWIIETPKTASSIRYNRLTDETTALLQELKTIMHGSDEEFIFNSAALNHLNKYNTHTGNKNEPMSRSAIRRAMYKYCVLAEVRKITPHGIRHSNASWLVETVETMEDVKVISNRLGHSSTQMTLDTYSHVLNSRESTMIGVLSSRKRSMSKLKS